MNIFIIILFDKIYSAQYKILINKFSDKSFTRKSTKKLRKLGIQKYTIEEY
jgi:hypothetical protein